MFVKGREKNLLLGAMLIGGILLALGEAANANSGIQFQSIEERLTAEIGKSYPGARIELVGPPMAQGDLPKSITGLKITGDNARGEAQFQVWNSETQMQVTVSFSAWAPAFVALRRIQPGEKLSSDLFVVQDVNLATGLAHEYRGVILGSATNLSNLEARQTILEGQYPMSTGVQKVPDVKRGDAVRIRMVAGDIYLNTAGIAQEPAYINGTIRVMTAKTKKELTGSLRDDGIVEVKL